ncbi:hypothetical protein FOCC_FOCC000414 [Frankliniella occidentalis]|nr:hypothetical protein FOCC_FOCC000414 [Frankliniella occidentalis]
MAARRAPTSRRAASRTPRRPGRRRAGPAARAATPNRRAPRRRRAAASPTASRIKPVRRPPEASDSAACVSACRRQRATTTPWTRSARRGAALGGQDRSQDPTPDQCGVRSELQCDQIQSKPGQEGRKNTFCIALW